MFMAIQWASLVTQMVKNLPAKQETQVKAIQYFNLTFGWLKRWDDYSSVTNTQILFRLFLCIPSD